MKISFQSVFGKHYQLQNIQSILLDLDGTLVDTLDLHVKSFIDILAEHGVSVIEEDMANLMGKTPQDIFKIYLPELSDEEIWEISIKKEEYLFNLIPSPESIKINSGVIDFLQHAGELGITRVVISSTHRSLVNRLLSNVGLTKYLDEFRKCTLS